MRISSIVRCAARAMTGSVYALFGYDTLKDPAGRAVKAGPVLAALRRVAPLPADDELLVRTNAITQIVSGSALALGICPQTNAIILAASLVPTTAAGHAFWKSADLAQRQAQVGQFRKNAAMLGGLLLCALDARAARAARRARRAAATN